MRTQAILLAALLGLSSCAEDTVVITEITCGNLLIEPGEECDTTTFGGLSCELFGYEGGDLSCTDRCTLDVRNCIGIIPTCGDGVLDVGEMCDGTLPDGVSCAKLGYGEGQLLCTGMCKIDVSNCSDIESICGDGIRTLNEECDGADYGDLSCGAFGFYGGELLCNSDCTVSLTSCLENGKCGDGTIQAAHEECDGANLDGASCQSQGYSGGTLGCRADCTLDTSGCEE